MGRLLDELSQFDNLGVEPVSETASYLTGDSKTALRDPRFLQDLRDYFTENGDDIGVISDDALIDKFYSDRSWADLNTLSAVKDAAEAHGMDATQRERAARLQQVWSKLPSFYQDGGRGIAALPDIAGALALDPVNLIGFGAGGAIAKGSARGAVAAGRSSSQAVRHGAVRGAGAAAAAEGAIGGVVGAGTDIAVQQRDIALGLQDEYSTGRTFGAAVGGAALGAAAGGLMNVPGAIGAARKGAAQADAFQRVGIPDERIARLSNKGADLLTRDPEALGDYRTELEAEINPPVEQEVAPAKDDSERVTQTLDRLNEIVDRQRRAVDAARADGAAQDQIDADEASLADLARLRSFGERLQGEAAEITTLEKSNDIKIRSKAAARRKAFERDYAAYRILIERPDEIGIDEAIANYEARMTPRAEAAPDTKTTQPLEATPASVRAEVQEVAPSATPDGAARQEPGAESAPTAPAQEPAPDVVPAQEPVTPAQPARIIASQKVIDEAAAAGVDLATVTGTGKNGRIRIEDVRQAGNAAPSDAPVGQAPDTAAPDTAAQNEPATVPEVVETVTPVAADADTSPVRITNTARKAAEKAGLDISKIKGTGPDGRGTGPDGAIGVADVKAARKIMADADMPDLADLPPAQAKIITDRALANARRAALAKGLDWRKAVANNPDMPPAKAVRQALAALPERTAGSEDAYVTRVRDSVAKASMLADEAGAETFDEAMVIVRALAKDAEFEEFGDDLVAYFDVLAQKADEKGLLFDDLDEGVLPSLTKDEAGRVKHIAHAMRQSEPDLDDEAVTFLAHKRVLDQRADTDTGAKSLTPSSGGNAERAGMWDGAGRNKNGRIQSFLRRSTAIAKGSDYGIGGEVEYPMAHKFNFDEAMIEARGKNGPDIVPFVSRGGEPVKSPTEKGFTRVPKGTILYADGITGHAYTSIDYAMFIRGDGKSRPGAVDRKKKADTPAKSSAATPEKKKALLDQARLVAEGKADAKMLVRQLKAKADGVTLAEDIPVNDGEKVLIIRNRKTGNLRMMSKAQIAKGATLPDLLGKADPADWDVNYAPATARRASQVELETLWNNLPKKDEAAASEQMAEMTAPGEPFTPDGPPPRAWNDAAMLEAPALDEAQARSITLALGETVQAGARPTYSDLMDWSIRVQQATWGRRPVATISDALSSIYSLMRSTVPEGHMGDVATRRQSQEQLAQIFANAAPEERAEAGRLLNSLKGDTRPLFAQATEGKSGFEAEPGINTVRVAEPDGSPRIHDLLRNVAHWSYFNVLTDADRMEFWSAMRKYEGDAAALTARQMTVENGPTGRIIDLFADEFAVWWSRRTAGSTLRDDSFWQRMTRYVKAVFDRYMLGVAIDPDLEPLFARILPNDAEAAERRTAAVRSPQSNAGRHIRKRLVEVQLIRDDLEDAIRSGSHSGILNAHETLNQMLFSLAPRQDRKAELGGEGDKAFRPVAKLIRVMRNRTNDYDEIMRGTGLGSASAREDGLSAKIDGDRIVEAAETLADFYENGYAVWQPEAGIPSRIKDLSATGTKALLDMIHNELDLSFKKAEGGHAPDVIRPQSARDRISAARTSAGTKQGRKKAARGSKKTAAMLDDLAARFSADAATLEAEGHSIAAARELSVTQLRNRLKKTDGPRSLYATVLREKLAAAPLPPKAVPVERRFVEMSKRDLDRAFYDAVENDNFDLLDQTSFELVRRAAKKAGDPAAIVPVIKPKERRVLDAIRLEGDHNQGISDQTGIPATAPARVRDLLSYLTHRDPNVTRLMRTMAYRMINLLDGSLDPAAFNVRGAREAAADAGLAHAVPAGVYDFRHPQFPHMRAGLRKLSVALAKGKVDPLDIAHELGHVLVRAGALPVDEFDSVVGFYRRSTDGIKAMQKQAYSELDERGLAEEWFAEQLAKYLSEQVTRGDVYARLVNGDIDGIRLRNGLSRAFGRMTEYLAYIVNGLIGRKDIKHTLRRLTFYGDMTGSGPRRQIAFEPQAVVSPALAATYASDVIRSSGPARKSNIEAFVSGGLGADPQGAPRIFYQGTPDGWVPDRNTAPELAPHASGNGSFGPGFYVTADPHVAGQVVNKPGAEAIERVARAESPEVSQDELAMLREDVSALSDIRRKISETRQAYAGAQSVIGDEAADLPTMRHQIDDLMQVEDALTADLVRAWGSGIDPQVTPLHIRLLKPADFRSGTTAARNAEFITALTHRLAGMDSLPAATLQVSEDAGMDEVYKRLVSAVANHLDADQSAARQAIREALTGLGYDGALTTQSARTGADGPDTGLHGAMPREDEIAVVFDPAQVRHINAAEFDSASPYPWAGDAESVPRGLNVALMDILAERRLGDVAPASVAEMVERKNKTALGSAVMSMLRGRKPSPRETAAMRDHSPLGWIKTQSGQMRHMGMNWLADWYENHFPNQQQAFASRYWPLRDALKNLPDADGAIRGWVRRSTGGIRQKQPESYARIMRALRRPTGSRQEAVLSAPERAVYDQVRRTMRQERERLVSLGVQMGNRGDDYMPQVWNTQAIEKDADGFISAMKDYYTREAIAHSKPFTDEDAEAFGRRMRDRLTGVESDGVFIPLSGGSRTSQADNLDNARMIQLDKFPEALQSLEKYLENDLDAILVKYLDGSSRRATFVEQMGVNNHALYDYLMVVDQGPKGIARLLSSDKIFAKEFNVLDWEAQPERMRLEQQVKMPFRDEGHAMPFVQKLMAAYETGGGGAARELLMQVAAKTRGGQPAPTYMRRAEAILGALADYKGKSSELKNPDFNFIEDAMRVAMKKRRQGSSEQAHKWSAAARNFNSLTLLSFTTLTSLGDLALPVVRSQSMRTYAKALRKYSTDPEYRSMIAGTGVAIENIVHDRMLHLFGTPSGKVTNAFFNATMLTPWTDMNRQIAGAVGFEAIKAMQAKAVRHHKAGVRAAEQQSRQYRIAHRFLTRYGLADFLPEGPRGKETLSNKALLESDETVRAAIIRFADDAIFTPNANDIPLWAQTPIGALVAQLKSFPLMMGRLSADLVREARQGNMTPLLYFAALAPAGGALALSAKDIIQQRGGEDGRSPELRHRNLMQTLGYDEKVHGNADDFLGWYAEGFLTAGGLGLLGDMAFGVAGQVEDGAYGQVRTASLLLGPTLGAGFSGMTVAAGVTDSNDSNSKERAGAREFASRIPFIGGVRSLREGIVDRIAGEKDEQGTWGGVSPGQVWK